MRSTLSMIWLFISFFIYSQETKNAKESRLKKDRVPATILQSLDGFLEVAKKVRFYSETDGKKKSFEVKMIFKKNAYSIEFDESSKLEDVEMLISENEVNTALYKKMKDYLLKIGKFKIEKVQKQFSSATKSNRQIIESALNQNTGDLIRYEVVVGIKEKGIWIPYEILFSEDGRFISKRKITIRSSEFILY